MFPSFMIRPLSEFTKYLYHFDNKKVHPEFKQKMFEFIET